VGPLHHPNQTQPHQPVLHTMLYKHVLRKGPPKTLIGPVCGIIDRRVRDRGGMFFGKFPRPQLGL